MKRCLSIFAILLLAACIEVGDMGPNWDKGTVDQALTGTWKQEAADTPEIRAITIENNEYRIESLDDKSRSEKDYKPVLARTLTIGAYTFFMTAPVPDKQDAKRMGCDIWRYTLAGDKVTLYRLQPGALNDYLEKLKKKHPKESPAPISVENHASGGTDNRYVTIQKLDDRVAKILASIPDNATYWAVSKAYTRQKP